MQIWIASLRLIMRDEVTPNIDFSIEKSTNKYSFNEHTQEYEECPIHYIKNSVSASMKIRYMYGGIVVEQGFKKEPLEEEIEKDMRKYLIRFLQRRRQEETQTYKKKIKLVKGISKI